jgi:hypothetical protein
LKHSRAGGGKPSLERKKPVVSDWLFSIMVAGAGFEPTTSGL